MLRYLDNPPHPIHTSCETPSEPKRIQRNEKEDMKLAIEYLYEFREKLSKLHPMCVEVMDNMLQRSRF